MQMLRKAWAFTTALTRPVTERVRALPKKSRDLYEYLKEDVKITLAQQRPLPNPPDYVAPPSMIKIWSYLFTKEFWLWLPGYMRDVRIPHYISYIYDPIKDEREMAQKMKAKVDAKLDQQKHKIREAHKDVLAGKPVVSGYFRTWIKQGTEGISAFTAGYREGRKTTYLTDQEIDALQKYAMSMQEQNSEEQRKKQEEEQEQQKRKHQEQEQQKREHQEQEEQKRQHHENDKQQQRQTTASTSPKT